MKGKYFKYAIGEIFLVVVGILIALSINNWNQGRIRKGQEEYILNAFNEILQKDIINLKTALAHYQRAEESINFVLEHIEKELPYSDSLKYHFFNTTLMNEGAELSNGVYLTLQSLGMDLISNTEIRDFIIYLYDEENPWIKSWGERYIRLLMNARDEIYNTRFEDFWNGDWRDLDITGTMEPLNYDLLKNDQEYLYFLKSQRNQLGWFIKKPIEVTMKDIEQLIKMLEQELEMNQD